MTDTPTMEECIMSTINEAEKQRAEAVRTAEQALALGVPFHFWVLLVDSKHGVESAVFRTEKEMQDFIREQMKDRWDDIVWDDNDQPIEMPEDFSEVFDLWCDYETGTSFSWEQYALLIYPSDLVKS